MNTCLFCKMVAGEIAPHKVYEDEHVLAFRDINPQAPVHVLIVPKQHIATLNDIDAAHAPVLAGLFLTAKRVAQAEGLADPGYRIVMNCNADGGQTVFHIHLHLLGGRLMGWPPG